MKFITALAAMTAASMFSTAAYADAISLSEANVGSSFTVNYNGFTGDGAIDGLSSSISFTLSGITGNSYTFDYAVNNTSTNPITASRVSGFGFDTNPQIASASSTGTFNTVGTDANVPNIGSVDVCFKGGGGTNSCAGGGGGGVSLGDSGTGSMTLDFSSMLSSLDLSGFFVRYQSIAGTGANTPGSAVGTGTISSSSGGGSSGGTPVPEPATLALFALGVAGLAMSRKGRQPRLGNS